MKGRRHAVTGVAAGVLTSIIGARYGVPVPVWVGACVAGSIWPDWDHPSASVARMWGPPTRAAAWVVARVTGGHRGGTHQPVVGAVLTAALMLAATLHSVSEAVAWAVITGALIAAAGRLVWAVPWPVNAAVSAAVGWVAYAHAWPVLAVAVPLILGSLVHIAGDRVRDTSPRAAHVEACSYVVITAWATWPLLTTLLTHLTERIST